MTEFAIIGYAQFTKYHDMVEVDHCTAKKLYFKQYLTHYDVKRGRVSAGGERRIRSCHMSNVHVRNATPELFAALVYAESEYDTTKVETLTKLKTDHDARCKKIIEEQGGTLP